jgi:hypothetical protein
MKIECLGKTIEIPEHLIDSYVKNFETLPGSGQRDAVLHLRNSVYEVFDYLVEDPEIIEEQEFRDDFIKAWAVYRALEIHGILHDS